MWLQILPQLPDYWGKSPLNRLQAAVFSGHVHMAQSYVLLEI